MREKPTGPIWVDYANALRQGLTVDQLVHVANLALNRLTLRDIGEIYFDAGIEPPMFDFCDATATYEVKS